MEKKVINGQEVIEVGLWEFLKPRGPIQWVVFLLIIVLLVALAFLVGVYGEVLLAALFG